MKKSVLTVLCFCFAFSAALSQNGSWLQKTNFANGGAARESVIAFSISTSGYIGLGNSGGGVNGTLWQYDTTANTWTQKASILSGGARQGAVCFVVGGKAYVGTGEDASFTRDKKFYEYNPNTNVWTAKADFPGTARTEAVAFAIGGKGYIGTGYDGARKKDFWEYDATSNTWTQKADFGGTARQGAVGFAVKGYGYIATGNDGARKKDVWRYDPTANTWTKKNDFGGTARELAVAFTAGNVAFIATGDSGSGTKDVWEYDDETDRWIRKTDFPGDGRYAAAAFAIGNKAYLGTGFSDAGSIGASKNDFWKFTCYKFEAPVVLPITYVTTNAIRIRWDHTWDALQPSFEILRSTNGLDFTTVGTAPGSTYSYIDNTLVNNQTYYYRVRATGTQGVSAASNIVSKQTQAGNRGLWTILPSNTTEPKSQRKVETFTIDNTIYLPFTVASNYVPNNVMWAYNPETAVWTEKATGPAPRMVFNSFVLNGKAYLVAGSVNGSPQTLYNDLWQYDPAANQWTQKTSFPGTARNGAFAFVINGKAYFGGGASGTTIFQDFWEYNPDTDSWLQKASIPEASSSVAGFAYQGKGYIGFSTSHRKMFEYNPSTNVWNTKNTITPIGSRETSSMSQARVLNGRVYIASYISSVNSFWEYIVNEDRFVELDLPAATTDNFEGSMAVAGEYLYLLLGVNGGENIKYDPESAVANVSGLKAEIIDDQRIKLSWTFTPATTTQLKIFRSLYETSGYAEVATLGGRPLEYIDQVVGTAGPVYYKVQTFSINGSSRLSNPVKASPQGAWRKLKNFTGGFDYMIAAATSAKGYFGLSSNSADPVQNKAWWEYDDASDTWTQKASFAGEPRQYAISMNLDDRIYVGLGHGFGTTPVTMKDLWQYDPGANVWTKKNDFTGPARKYASGASFNGIGYLVMGDDGSETTFMKDLWRYDPAADSWTALPDYPGMGTRSPLLTFYNNELIVMNGYSRSSATSYSSTRDHYILSLSNNTWRKGPVPTYWTSGESTYVTVGEYFYCTYYFSTISLLQYHIPSGKWEIPNMPFVAGARGFLLKGKIYFITSTREVWVYDPGSYVATPSDLTSELKDGHLKIKWKNNSSVPVTTVLEYQKNSQNGSVAFTKLAEISGGTTEYEVSDYKLNTHYYIRAYNINAKGEFSPYSNITTAHTGPYWSKVADIPITSRTGAFLQAADNKLFYGLGSESGTSNLQKDLWMYDEVTGVWTQKANYVGAARYNTESFVLGGALYVGMGMNSSSIDFSDLYKYDISTNTWTASVSFPKANYRRFSVFVYNGNAYFVGGQVNTSNSSVELYRFSGSAWTQLTSIPGDPRADPITFVIGGKAYVGSGEKIVNGSYYTANKEFFEYDIASDTWKKLADLPHEALYTHGAWSSFSYVVNDFAYVFVQGSRNTFKYAPATGIWSTSVTSLYTYSSYQVPMAISNSGLAYGVVNMPDKTELWRFDPLIGGPSITELTNPAIRTVMVRWNEIIPQPDSVFVERGISEEDAFVKVAVVKTNSTTTTDIVPEGGKDYYYRIRSFKGASNVRLSAAKKINVALPPTGPALSIIYDEGNAKLSWTAITGATQYGVEKSVNDGPFTALATVTGTSYTDALPEQKKYSYRVYSINPETRRSNEVFLLITGAEQSYASGFSIYPNPASDEIEVQVPEPGMNYQCTMLNNNGKTLFSTVVRNSSRINISAYPAGIYFITLQPENAVYSKVIKVVKK